LSRFNGKLRLWDLSGPLLAAGGDGHIVVGDSNGQIIP
jgi:hypothetical protein